MAKLPRPRTVKDVVRQIPWKKLPVGEWMERTGMGPTNRCPQCSRVEDNAHRVQQCPCLEVRIQLATDRHRPIEDEKRKRIEPVRIFLEHQKKSPETEQGILMWTAIAAFLEVPSVSMYSIPMHRAFSVCWEGYTVGRAWRWEGEWPSG